LTSLKSYDVGAGALDTPTLVEIWRTAPYLHDGSAATLREVLTTANPNDRHGKTSHLSSAQIDDLAAYLESL
jgi:cytochrome c peroxidase